ncbi:CUB and sushi domain-containing protein 3-like, partial [Ruditapes philippinarum]|uniref:CUB and sushi domain-containing protein 3-like n=1 Tax=Ruditapes philippinarum TaxID=129788 RepID=UPI00295AE2F1
MGYTLNGSHTLICKLDGTWDSEPPTCNVKDCGEIIQPIHGSVSLISNKTTFRATAFFKCSTGYELTDDKIARCNASGQWTSNPECKIKDCKSPPDLENGNVSTTNGTTYESVSTFTCDLGFTLEGDDSTKCTENGTWTIYNTSCIINDCHSPIGPINGNATAINGTTYLSIARYVCDKGFDLSGSDTTICQANGSWSGTIPTCNIKDINECARYTNDCDLQAICSNTEGSYTCKCPDKYTDNSKNGETGRDCQDINECNDTSTCGVKASCTNFDGGYNCTCNKDFPKGDPTFHCYGYYDKNKAQMKGVSSTLIKCSENGTWVKVPKCVRKDCGNLTDITITNAVHRRLHTDTKFESIADIDCDDGYYIKGRIQTAGISTQTITCSDTGTWINVPECVPKDCGRLEQLNLSNAKDRNLINGTTIYTSLANISCDEGYKELNRSQVLGITYTVVRCNENGTWANLPQCVRKDCGDVQNIKIEHAANRILLNGDTKYNDTAEVTCDLGYYDTDQKQTTG